MANALCAGGCGKVMRSSGTRSLPAGQRMCHPCRRRLNPPPPPKSMWIGLELACPTCGVKFTQQRWGQVYCRVECRPKRHYIKLSTVDRGYDAQHRRWRRRALAELLPGAPCPRCGEPMWPDSQDLDLDHTDDRSGYLGLSHAFCNRSAGAKVGNRQRRPWWRRRRRQLALFPESAVKPRRPFRGICTHDGCTDERARRSDRCPWHLRRLERVAQVSKRCAICGEPFISTAKSPTKTCGEDCRDRYSAANRKKECRRPGCSQPANRAGRLCARCFREVARGDDRAA